MTDGKRAALYARVSTTEQSPENQLLDLRRYCTGRGWTAVEPAYIDLGVSGAKADRPALRRLMDDVRKRRVDVVLVWRFDRFARSVSHLVSALDEFNERGVGFASYSENVDTTTSQGKLVFNIMAAIAQFERDLIRDRIMAGIARARMDGRHLGRPPVSKDTVAEILEMRGRPQRSIAVTLGVSRSLVQKVLAAALRAAEDPAEQKAAAIKPG